MFGNTNNIETFNRCFVNIFYLTMFIYIIKINNNIYLYVLYAQSR